MSNDDKDASAISSWPTFFTEHRGERVHVVTYASVNRFVMHLALSLRRAGGFLNVLGTQSDAVTLPPEYNLDLSIRSEHNFTFGYRGNENSELDYRRILFKRLYYIWLLSQSLPREDIIVYVDGHDVLFQRPVDDLVDSWHEITASYPKGEEPAVFMGYPWCRNRFNGRQMQVEYPLPNGGHFLGAGACHLWRRKQRSGTLPFVDTGGYMGRASAIQDLLADAAYLARLDLDYICMTSMHAVGLRRPDRFWVDTEARLFYSIISRRPQDSLANWTVELARPLCEAGYFDEAGQPPLHTVTEQVPVVLHFVGPAKWYYLNRCVDKFLEEARSLYGNDEQSQASGSFPSVTACYHSAPCNLCKSVDLGECFSMEGQFGFHNVDTGQTMTYPFSILHTAI